jgi:hypothetical protein
MFFSLPHSLVMGSLLMATSDSDQLIDGLPLFLLEFPSCRESLANLVKPRATDDTVLN